MSSGRSRSLEPYDGKRLTAYLEAKGAKFVRQTGSHLHFEMPNGARVGSLIHGAVPSVMARGTATALGIPYKQMRAELGFPIVDTGRSRAKPTVKVQRISGPTKAQVLKRLDAAIADLSAVRESLRCGQKSQAIYDRTYAAIKRAEPHISEASDAANGRSVA